MLTAIYAEFSLKCKKISLLCTFINDNFSNLYSNLLAGIFLLTELCLHLREEKNPQNANVRRICVGKSLVKMKSWLNYSSCLGFFAKILLQAIDAIVAYKCLKLK